MHTFDYLDVGVGGPASKAAVHNSDKRRMGNMTNSAAVRIPAGLGARRRRRFLVVSVAALAVLAAALGVSFTADSGSTTVSVSAGTTNPLVFPRGVTLSTDKKFKVSGSITGTSPSWSPVAGTSGSVTTKGDLAFIDGRTTSAGGATRLTITVYVTNLPALQKTYGSFAFPVRLYGGTYNGTTTVWTSPTTLASSDTTYLTNTGGFLSFSVDTAASGNAGSAIGVQLGGDVTGDGGSFYTVCTDTSDVCTGGSLGPSFFITAQPS